MKLRLREDLEIELNSWNGKTKKDFVKLFREKGQNRIKESDVFEILVKPFIIPNDIFLSAYEYQYVLIKLKELSIGGKVDFEMNCDNPKCNERFEVETNLKDISDYRVGKFPLKLAETTSFRNIPTQSVFDAVVSNFPNENQTYLQMLMSIDNLNGKPSESIEQLIEDMNEISISTYNEIEKFFLENESRLDLGIAIKCPHCEQEKEYTFDLVPKFFNDLLPKR